MDKYIITQEPVNDATVILKPEQVLDNNNAYKMVMAYRRISMGHWWK